MNTEKLLSMQEMLNAHAATTYNVSNENTFEEKIVALLAIVGDLANKSACTSYFDLNEKGTLPEILQEYVKGLAYLLSIGRECDFQDNILYKNRIHISEQNVTKQLLNVFEAVCLFKVRKSIEVYTILYVNYVHLGDLLGLERKEVEETYMSKGNQHFMNMQ